MLLILAFQHFFLLFYFIFLNLNGIGNFACVSTLKTKSLRFFMWQTALRVDVRICLTRPILEQLAQIRIFYLHTSYYERKKIANLLNLGLSQSIFPNFWLIYLTLTPTFTTWTYFQDENHLIIWNANKWLKKGSLSITTCFLSICLGIPGSWPLRRKSLRLPDTLISNTDLKIRSRSQPGPCKHCSQLQGSRNLLYILSRFRDQMNQVQECAFCP